MKNKPNVPQASDETGFDTDKPHPNPASKSPRRGEDFGAEGTNKTIPVPLPDAEPTEELQGTKTKFIPDSPYTRG